MNPKITAGDRPITTPSHAPHGSMQRTGGHYCPPICPFPPVAAPLPPNKTTTRLKQAACQDKIHNERVSSCRLVTDSNLTETSKRNDPFSVCSNLMLPRAFTALAMLFDAPLTVKTNQSHSTPALIYERSFSKIYPTFNKRGQKTIKTIQHTTKYIQGTGLLSTQIPILRIYIDISLHLAKPAPPPPPHPSPTSSISASFLSRKTPPRNHRPPASQTKMKPRLRRYLPPLLSRERPRVAWGKTLCRSRCPYCVHLWWKR